MQTRISAHFSENYLDAPAVRSMFYSCLDANVRVARGWGNSPTCVAFVVYGPRTALSLFRFYRWLHQHDPFAQLMVDGQTYSI